MTVFPLLAEPDRYRPMMIDLVDDAVARDYWLDVFANHLPSLADHCIESDSGADAAERAELVRERFSAMIAALRSDPRAYDERVGPISILGICRLREQVMREQGFADPYQPIKQRENEAALQLLPALLDELDGLDDRPRLEVVVTGIAAGNLFDLGAAGSYEKYRQGGFDFHATRDKAARPWRVDDVDALIDRLLNRPPTRAMLLVDNAGADLVLGMLPLARELLARGAQVILAANTTPSLNDIIIDELGEVLGLARQLDPYLDQACDEGALACVASGNDVPLIDFRQISEEMASASAGVDLLVVEGMGRALESNYDARFTCDTLKIGMIKEGWVAQIFDAELYDVICRFEPKT